MHVRTNPSVFTDVKQCTDKQTDLKLEWTWKHSLYVWACGYSSSFVASGDTAHVHEYVKHHLLTGKTSNDVMNVSYVYVGNVKLELWFGEFG